MPGDVVRAWCGLRAAPAVAVFAVVMAGEFAIACSHRPRTPAQGSTTTTTMDGGATRGQPGTKLDAGARAGGGMSSPHTPNTPNTPANPNPKDGGSSTSVSDNNTDHSGTKPGFPLKLGPNGARYLVDQNG